jgi:hypothetical protein
MAQAIKIATAPPNTSGSFGCIPNKNDFRNEVTSQTAPAISATNNTREFSRIGNLRLEDWTRV